MITAIAAIAVARYEPPYPQASDRFAARKNPLDFRNSLIYGTQEPRRFLGTSSPSGVIVASWGLNVWRELLLFYRNFGSMSPHPEELLHIYIILGPFAPSRSETGEIPAGLQDSLSGEVVHIELLYLRSISPTG
ncbi:hypothetical protein [Paenibacillus dendritiformis]|uniref:hypothetical protein n=2 Tax=Paenibacillus dendritiformis TaxID=130049 RepID=UPI0018CD5B3F|nr:hypothetical protein [Paenibacillus dendritiformis]